MTIPVCSAGKRDQKRPDGFDRQTNNARTVDGEQDRKLLNRHVCNT